MDKDLGGGAGITADSFDGLGANKTDADGGSEKTGGAGDVTEDFSEDEVHDVDVFFVLVSAVRARWHAPNGKGLVAGVGGVTFGVVVIIAMIAD